MIFDPKISEWLELRRGEGRGVERGGWDGGGYKGVHNFVSYDAKLWDCNIICVWDSTMTYLSRKNFHMLGGGEATPSLFCRSIEPGSRFAV